MQKTDATTRNDACARSAHISKLETAMCQWFRTYETPTEYAAHCREKYRATVDIVSCPEHVRVQLPLRMRWSMLPKMHSLTNAMRNGKKMHLGPNKLTTTRIILDKSWFNTIRQYIVVYYVCVCSRLRIRSALYACVWCVFNWFSCSKLAPILNRPEQTSWKL